MFGLVSLMIVIALAAWWLVSMGPVAAPPSDSEAVSMHDGSSFEQVEVYAGISVPVDTKTLNLSGRNLSGSLKAEIRLLTQLETLDVSNNDFTGLPAEVGQLSELRMLNLASNPLTGLPHEIGNLQKLRVLDVRGTKASEGDLIIIGDALPSSTSILTGRAPQPAAQPTSRSNYGEALNSAREAAELIGD